jgi:hypothetical protein
MHLCVLPHSPTEVQNHDVIEEDLLYVLVLWMMAQETYNYSAQATLCLSQSSECLKNILLNSVLLKIYFTPLLYKDLPSVSLQII